MRFEEKFEVVDGHVERTIVAGEFSSKTKVADCSSLGKKAPAWSRWWRSYVRGATPELIGRFRGTINVVDLCSGCGGLALGVRQAALALGYDSRMCAAVDVDQEALMVHRLNHNTDYLIAQDVSRLTSFQVRGTGRAAVFAYPPDLLDERLGQLHGKVELVVAGPPCEGHSNLNNRTRRDDPRNLLLLEAVATAVALGPKAIIIENVPDVVNDAKGVVDTALGLLSHAGFSTQSGVLSAYELGLPQTRKRFFILASKSALSVAEIEESLGNRAKTDVKWAIQDLLDCHRDPSMDGTVEVSPETQARIDWLFDNGEYDLRDEMRPDCHKDGNTYGSVYGRLRWNHASGTITTGFVTMGRGRFVHPLRRRTLTPHEAARIQGFPDTFRFRRNTDDSPPKKSLVKWIGDAVPPILGYATAMGVLLPILVEFSPQTDPILPRSTARMKAVRQSNTAPEAEMRRLLRAAGFRYEANRRGLPGTPDIVFPKQRVAVFVHGCYWHQHEGCKLATVPKTRTDFWLKKFADNKARDKRNLGALRRIGWRPVVVWQCGVQDNPEAQIEAVRRVVTTSAKLSQRPRKRPARVAPKRPRVR